MFNLKRKIRKVINNYNFKRQIVSRWKRRNQDETAVRAFLSGAGITDYLIYNSDIFIRCTTSNFDAIYASKLTLVPNEELKYSKQVIPFSNLYRNEELNIVLTLIGCEEYSALNNANRILTTKLDNKQDPLAVFYNMELDNASV